MTNLKYWQGIKLYLSDFFRFSGLDEFESKSLFRNALLWLLLLVVVGTAIETCVAVILGGHLPPVPERVAVVSLVVGLVVMVGDRPKILGAMLTVYFTVFAMVNLFSFAYTPLSIVLMVCGSAVLLLTFGTRWAMLLIISWVALIVAVVSLDGPVVPGALEQGFSVPFVAFSTLAMIFGLIRLQHNVWRLQGKLVSARAGALRSRKEIFQSMAAELSRPIHRLELISSSDTKDEEFTRLAEEESALLRALANDFSDLIERRALPPYMALSTNLSDSLMRAETILLGMANRANVSLRVLHRKLVINSYLFDQRRLLAVITSVGQLSTHGKRRPGVIFLAFETRRITDDRHELAVDVYTDESESSTELQSAFDFDDSFSNSDSVGIWDAGPRNIAQWLAEMGGVVVSPPQLDEVVEAHPAVRFIVPMEPSSLGVYADDYSRQQLLDLLNDKHVMVVDDDSVFRAATRSFLERVTGATVTTVATGSEALQRLSQAPAVDLLITDLHMPEMSGLELLINVRKSFPRLIVVATTVSRDKEDQEALRASGAIAILRKPMTEDGLASVLKIIQGELSR